MCGRNSLFIDLEDLEQRFEAKVESEEAYETRYNIAPGGRMEIITNNSPDEIKRFHWGLIPFWADEPEEGIINARSETVDEKRVFEQSWESHPCLVLSTGFYEWQSKGGSKQPYRIFREDDPAFAMAGIWDQWEGDSASISCMSILTTEPNDLMKPIHDRMPVVLPKDAEDVWLSTGSEHRKEMCRPYPDEDLAADPITTRVNNPQNDDPQVIESIDSEQSGLDEFFRGFGDLNIV
ncbi:SOS response-associated peptidase [Halocatena halophila]|uniref:SOS response-associated peptidase n=1 Tax=Halocatena halophila TaxID=2814576 RepID=UPI002ED24610